MIPFLEAGLVLSAAFLMLCAMRGGQMVAAVCGYLERRTARKAKAQQ